MSRSRAALLLVWASLAAITVVQFLRPDGGEAAADEPPAALAEVETPPDRGPGGTASVPRPVVRADEQPSGSTVAVTPTPPISSTPSLVATATGDGVASFEASDAEHPTHWFPNPTQFDGDRTFLVLDDTSSPDRIKVSLPVMPNGQEGWIPRSAVTVSTVQHQAVIDLSERSVTVWDGDELVVATGAVTGRPATPTPVGQFFLRDIVAQTDPAGEFGPWVLALSGFSETLDTFQGGLPALALHGTDRPGTIGTSISSGCIRVPNDVITLLAETVPLGTPVSIVS